MIVVDIVVKRKAQLGVPVRYGTNGRKCTVIRMDRRQKKTKEAIFTAFSLLLRKKKYEHITVQDIIDGADIGRSTFYAHFETKDELLKAMCRQIFEHIFSDDLMGEETHDFSGKTPNLEDKLVHLLYHLKDQQAVISGILSSGGKTIFMRFFKEYLSVLFSEYVVDGGEVPREYLMNHFISSFAESVDWWVRQKMKEEPEAIARYYFAVSRRP